MLKGNELFKQNCVVCSNLVIHYPGDPKLCCWMDEMNVWLMDSDLPIDSTRYVRRARAEPRSVDSFSPSHSFTLFFKGNCDPLCAKPPFLSGQLFERVMCASSACLCVWMQWWQTIFLGRVVASCWTIVNSTRSNHDSLEE